MVAFGLIKLILTASLRVLNIYVQGLQEKKPHMLKCCVGRAGGITEFKYALATSAIAIR